MLRKQRIALIESGPGRLQRSIRLGFAQGLAQFPLAVAVLLLAAAFLVSVVRGYSLFDGIANWALKGYAIAYEGTVFAGARWGGHGLEYPQNVDLLIALFRLLDGDALPGSKLLFPAFASCLLLGLYRFLRKAGVSVVFAGLGVLTLLSVPVLYFHTTIGWGNLIFTTYLVLVACWLRGDLGLDEAATVARFALAQLLRLETWGW